MPRLCQPRRGRLPSAIRFGLECSNISPGNAAKRRAMGKTALFGGQSSATKAGASFQKDQAASVIVATVAARSQRGRRLGTHPARTPHDLRIWGGREQACVPFSACTDAST
jgi:hypothetical protein